MSGPASDPGPGGSTGGPTLGTGALTRLAIFLQVAAVVLLAVAACGLVIWLSGREGLRLRYDLTAAKRNTLDPALSEVIEKLPEQATLEIFFRDVDPPLVQVGREIHQRTRELLYVARNQHPDRLRIVDHDLADIAPVAARMGELGLNEVNVVVVQMGERRAVLRLFRDLGRISPGNPVLKIPPSLDSFRGDEAFGEALLRVSVDGRPKVLFSKGHGERDLYSTEPRMLGSLHSLLVADGFDAAWWDPRETPRIPDDCAVLAIVDPTQPFAAEELAEVRRYLSGGGRLLATASLTESVVRGPGSTGSLLASYGIEAQTGFIAQPVLNSVGQQTDGSSECALLYLNDAAMDRRHPVTESLARAGGRVLLPKSRWFLRGTTPEHGVLTDLLRTPAETWRDLTEGGINNWTWDTRREEHGPFVLAMTAAFPSPGAAADDDRRSVRIVALGCPDMLGNGQDAGGPVDVNRDFVLNAFNWLSSRDRRLVVRPRTEDLRLLDIKNESHLGTVNRVASWFLPGACAALGLLLYWRRRK